MSDLIIKDGTGSGNRAEVDSSNRLVTLSTTKSEFLYYCEVGNSYVYASNGNPILADGYDYVVLWWKNIDPINVFNVEHLFVSYNGGNTTGTKRAQFSVNAFSGEPSGSTIKIQGGNINFTSSNVALDDAYLWDGTNTGIVLSSPGITLMSQYIGEMVVLPFEGSAVFGYNQSFYCSFTVPEDGLCSVAFAGYYRPKIG
jgi:hypothetical protein